MYCASPGGFLERQAEHEDIGIRNLDASLGHQFDHALRHVRAHAVVYAPPGKDDLGMVAELLRFVREIVRIHADAMTADEAGARRRNSRLTTAACSASSVSIPRRWLINANSLIKAMFPRRAACFDHLGHLGDTDTRCAMRAHLDDLAVQRVDELRGRRRRPRCDLDDAFEPVCLVTRIDAFRAVAGIKIHIVAQARARR